MFKRRKISIVILLIVMLLCTLTSCKLKAETIFGNDEEKITYRTDYNISLSIEKPRTLNPLISKDEDVYQISKLVYESLFELDETLVPRPLLVKDYHYDDTAHELSLELNRNIKWHDGENFDGDDVKFTIEALQSLARSGDTLYTTHVSNIKSVKVSESSPYSVTIKYNSDTGVGLENLIFPILPMHKFKNNTILKKSINDFDMIGTGKYQLDKYYDLSILTLVPFASYHGEKAQSTLNFQILPNKDYAINMTEAGDVSIFFDKSLDRDTILSKHDLYMTSYLSNEIEILAYNFSNEIIANKDIRKAIAYAFDTEAILSSYYYGNGIIADSLFYPNYYGSENRGDSYIYDIDKAKEHFAKAGFSHVDEAGLLINEKKNHLEIDILVCSDYPERLSAGSSIKNSLEKLGVIANLDACSNELYYAKLAEGKFDIYIGGIHIDERYDLCPILHSQYANKIKYSNPKVDEYLEEMQKWTLEVRKTQLVENLKEIMIEDLPYYPMFYKTYGCFTSKYFDSELMPMFNNTYKGCESWQCKYPESLFEQE